MVQYLLKSSAVSFSTLTEATTALSYGFPPVELSPRVVTLWYRPPEILFGDVLYAEPVDYWALGCIFGELLKHAPLLPGKTEVRRMDGSSVVGFWAVEPTAQVVHCSSLNTTLLKN